MVRYSLIFFMLFYQLALSQKSFPFEAFPAIKYNEINNWKKYNKIKGELVQTHYTSTLSKFYLNGDTLTIQLTCFATDSSFIRIFRNKKQIQKLFEPMFYSDLNVMGEALRWADINNDSLSDIKVLVPYMGCGLAALNYRVIYFFQQKDGTFKKISYLDKMDRNRAERDLDGDGEFEIITMCVKPWRQHNYWTFNLYNFKEGELKNQNSRFNYPLMVQMLFRENYKVTDKIKADKMKSFGDDKPRAFYQN